MSKKVIDDTLSKKVIEGRRREYGADVSECEVGNFAVNYAKYAGIPGVEIVEITKVHKDGVREGEESFEGVVYGPASTKYTETTIQCLSRIWNKSSKSKTRSKRKTIQDSIIYGPLPELTRSTPEHFKILVKM